MRRLLPLALGSLIVGVPLSASANTISVELRNRSSDTAYVVTAFATELVPNFWNLTSIPLTAGESRSVTIFDDFSKCVFTITVDYNPPRRPGRKAVKNVKPFRIYNDINICRQRTLDLR